MTILTHDEIARLSVTERLALIGELWDSLADGEPPIPATQLAEIDRRMDSFEHDLKQAVTWKQLKAELATRAP